MSSRFVSLTGVAIFLISFQSVPAFAQVDLSGQWAAINQSDAKTRGPGPDLMETSQTLGSHPIPLTRNEHNF